MAKLADIHVHAINEDNTDLKHRASYPCTVDSAGIFAAEIPEDIEAHVKGECGRQRDLRCKVERVRQRGGAFKLCLVGPQMASLEKVLQAYSRSMVEATVADERRIFYTLNLGAPFFRDKRGGIHPNGQGVEDGKWAGQSRLSSSRDSGAEVGVGASIVIQRTVTTGNGTSAVSYERPADNQLGEHGKLLRRWTGQPWPRTSFSEPSGMRSVAYSEEMAALFHSVLMSLARTHDLLERNLDNAAALPALLASGAQLRLS